MSTQVNIMPFIVREYKRCQSHPNSIRPVDTGNCYKKFQSDALQFGVNSPQPSTSGVSQRVQTTSRQAQPSPVTQYMQPTASPCRPTIVKYEPPAFSLEQPTQMLTRDEQNQVLQNHVAAANAVFNKVAVFERLIQQEPHNTMYYEEVQ